MLSESFLQLVESVLKETISYGNVDTYFGKPYDNIQEHYRQMTKWSDFRILVPILFNFFHGIELLLKAANYKIKSHTGRPNHKLPHLLEDFKVNYPNAVELTCIFNKYIYTNQTDSAILNDFYISNNISDSSQFYEVFKYPYSKDFQTDFNYKDLRNLKTDGINFFRQIIKDIQIIRTESEKL